MARPKKGEGKVPDVKATKKTVQIPLHARRVN